MDNISPTRILQLVNSMLLKSEKITDIKPYKDHTVFFKFNHQFIFGISEFNFNYILTLYPDMTTDYVGLTSGFLGAPKIEYKTEVYKLREMTDSFRDLYDLVRGKGFNVESIFDNIINS